MATLPIDNAKKVSNLTEITKAAQSNLLLIHDGNGLKKIRADNLFDATLLTNAGAHNSICRGKSLGSAVTEAQWAAIMAGTFEGMYIGDFWTINDVNWRIAAFDYYYNAGDTSCTTHHVTIVPDTALYSHVMNDSNIVDGAYVGSKMYAEGLEAAKTMINSAFGEEHVLNHRQYLQNAVTDEYASAGAWYDSTVELMTEQNVYGCKIYGNFISGTNTANNATLDKNQYPLFASRSNLIRATRGTTYHLRDVATKNAFAIVYGDGRSGYAGAAHSSGVRPSFSIIG